MCSQSDSPFYSSRGEELSGDDITKSQLCESTDILRRRDIGEGMMCREYMFPTELYTKVQNLQVYLGRKSFPGLVPEVSVLKWEKFWANLGKLAILAIKSFGPHIRLTQERLDLRHVSKHESTFCEQ